jgi:hypothetical protein
MMPRHVDVAAVLVIIICAAAIAWTITFLIGK